MEGVKRVYGAFGVYVVITELEDENTRTLSTLQDKVRKHDSTRGSPALITARSVQERGVE